MFAQPASVAIRPLQVSNYDQGLGVHNEYLFANVRATRNKLLVHDAFAVWCNARRLHSGRFVWPRERATAI